MKHSIALVTGATSGLSHVADRLLDGECWHEIIVTGHSLTGTQQAAAQATLSGHHQLTVGLLRSPSN